MGSRRSNRQKRFARAVVYTLVLLLVLGLVGSMMSAALASTALASTALASTARATSVPETTSPGDGDPIVVLATTGWSWSEVAELATSSPGSDGAETTEPAEPAEPTEPANTTEAAAATELLRYAGTNTPVNLVQRVAGDRTCPADAWFVIGTGTRTRVTEPTTDCAWPDSWNQAVATSQAAGYGASPGTLTGMLMRAGVSVAAVGPGAELALTPSTGEPPTTADTLPELIEAGLPDVTLVDTANGAPNGSLAVLVEALDQLPDNTRVVVASIADPTDPGLQMAILPAGAESELGEQDGLLVGPSTRRPGLLQLTDLPTSLVGAATGASRVGMDGGLVTLPVSVPPSPPARTEAEPAAVPEEVNALIDDAAHAKASNRAVIPSILTLIGTTLVLLVVAARVLRRPAPSPSLMPPLPLLAAACLVTALPAGALLANSVPWWRADRGAPAVAILLMVVWAASLVGVTAVLFRFTLNLTQRLWPHTYARLGTLDTHPPRATHPAAPAAPPTTTPPRTTTHPTVPPASLTAASTAVFAATASPIMLLTDAANGAGMSFNGPLGMDAIVAGRFYGMSNTAFALAAGALVVLIGALVGHLAAAQPTARVRITTVGVGFLGGLALVLDGAPQLGADVGGALTLTPSFVALAAGLAGVTLGWRRWLVVGAATVGLVGGFGLLDYLAGSHTHLGRFIDQVLSGTAGQTLVRKTTALVAPFVSSALALTALAVGLGLLAGAAWWLRRTVREARAGQGPYAWLAVPGALPWWLEAVGRALAVLVVVEVLVNDSGVAMFWLSAATALPTILALVMSRLVVADALRPGNADALRPGNGG